MFLLTTVRIHLYKYKIFNKNLKCTFININIWKNIKWFKDLQLFHILIRLNDIINYQACCFYIQQERKVDIKVD